MKNWLREFKEFAVKGNVVDLAVGVIIGAAFGKIVTSLVNDIVMPPLGLLMGGVDFSQLKVILSPAAEGHGEVAIRYGIFLQNITDFLIVAWAIFVAVKVINKLRREKPAGAGPMVSEISLLTEIRDLLKK